MRTKQVIMSIFSGLLIIFMIWLIREALRPQVLPLGSLLPKAAYEICEGRDTLRIIPHRSQVLMLFHTRCPHCMYQLEVLESNAEAFSGRRLFLVTTEENFSLCYGPLQWPKFACAQHVVWAYISESEFKRHFGRAISPSIFIFDESGILRQKIRGEVKLDKILAGLP